MALHPSPGGARSECQCRDALLGSALGWRAARGCSLPASSLCCYLMLCPQSLGCHFVFSHPITQRTELRQHPAGSRYCASRDKHCQEFHAFRAVGGPSSLGELLPLLDQETNVIPPQSLQADFHPCRWCLPWNQPSAGCAP